MASDWITIALTQTAIKNTATATAVRMTDMTVFKCSVYGCAVLDWRGFLTTMRGSQTDYDAVMRYCPSAATAITLVEMRLWVSQCH